MAKKARRLKNIELEEVSLVDLAANKEKFIFFKCERDDGGKVMFSKKKKLSIGIESDGTVGGTKITVNGDKLKDVRDFNFSFWGNDDESRPVSCSYSKFVETDDGFKRSETFYFSKGDITMQKEILEQLQEYFGNEAEKIDFEKAEDGNDIAEALKMVNSYKGELPDDLKKAIGSIAKQAGFCDTLINKMLEKNKNDKNKNDKTEDDVSKSGAKFSKETLEKLKKVAEALEALKDIIPELKEGTEKSSTEKSAVEKAIEGITKSITELEKKKGEESSTELTKTLEELKKRLTTIEKSTGVKKGLDGQETNDDDPTEAGEKKLWPSISKPSS